jgi:rfaE bifunctional protein kinase chain/domain/rfaE bifunctional protein nucleotidyltransferase chain/domain
MKKIIDINTLKNKIAKIKKNRKKIILCHGVFDLLHIGHIKHLKIAKNLGDILIVSLTTDKFVNKGPGRPIFNEKLRCEAIESLGFVDYVTLSNSPSAVEIINKIKPNIYCKGNEYEDKSKDVTKKINLEEKVVKKNGGKILFTNEETFSSSSIINKSFDIISPNQKKTNKKIVSNNSLSKIIKEIDNLKELKILVIGETIIDQYSFCDPLNKSGKDPMLVLKHNKTEEYLGGAIAITKHLKQFNKNISLLTVLGEKKEYRQKICNELSKKVKINFIYKKNSKTITKKRYLDEISNNKLLGVYEINDSNLSNYEERNLQKKLKSLIPKHDLVIVSDYGHGFISKESAKIISKLSKFLSLNAQVNSSNVGYHTIKNYKNYNCLIINEKEIRHEFRDRLSKVESLMKILSKSQNIQNIIVTKGVEGSVLFNKNHNKYFYCDAFSKKAIDKIGAGDTMLSIISMCLKNNLPKDLSLLISSLAAAKSVNNFGNKETINKVDLIKTLEHMLK